MTRGYPRALRSKWRKTIGVFFAVVAITFFLPAPANSASATGPVAYYLFNGNGDDITGKSDPMVLNNTIFEGDTLYLNGTYWLNCESTGYKAEASLPLVNFEAFTVGLSFKAIAWNFAAPCSGWSNTILVGGLLNRWFRIQRNPNTGNLEVTLNNTGTSDDIIIAYAGTGSSLSIGTWHTVWVSVNVTGGQVIAFLDGVSLGSSDLPGDFVLNHDFEPYPTLTFTDLSNTKTFYGFVDNLVVYDRALTEAEIAALSFLDGDGDGIPDEFDNCPAVSNPYQEDTNGNGVGDACELDPCAELGGDSDGDGICDDVDNCPFDMNPDQADYDGDGLGDICDLSAMNESPPEQPDGNVVVAHSPDGATYLDVTVTLKWIQGLEIDINDDGVLDGTPYIRPNEYNVVPQVLSGAVDIPADTIHCGPPCSIPEDIVLITQAEGSRDFVVKFPLSKWWTGLSPNTYLAPVRYVNYCKELRATGDPEPINYPGIYQGEVPLGSTSVNIDSSAGDQCRGDGYGFGQGAGGTGCPYADYNRVIMHEVNIGRGISCDKHPLSGASVRVYDRNNPFFKTKFGSKALLSFWYGTIFESVLTPEQGMIGSCITNDSGECYVGEKKKGSYLVIVRYQDSQTHKTVYTGGTKGLRNFGAKSGLAKMEFNIIKVTSKFGVIEFRGATRTLFSGSVLEVLSPDSAISEGTRSVYPFIFTSDSDWGVDVCAEVPSGYSVVGVYDANGDLLPSTNCVQTFVKGETKTIAFEVQGTGSSGPSLRTTLTVRNPKSKKVVQKMETKDFRKKTFVDEVKKAKALVKKNSKWRSNDHL
jgi:hypothetical protein